MSTFHWSAVDLSICKSISTAHLAIVKLSTCTLTCVKCQPVYPWPVYFKSFMPIADMSYLLQVADNMKLFQLLLSPRSFLLYTFPFIFHALNCFDEVVCILMCWFSIYDWCKVPKMCLSRRLFTRSRRLSSCQRHEASAEGTSRGEYDRGAGPPSC